MFTNFFKSFSFLLSFVRLAYWNARSFEVQRFILIFSGLRLLNELL